LHDVARHAYTAIQSTRPAMVFSSAVVQPSLAPIRYRASVVQPSSAGFHVSQFCSSPPEGKDVLSVSAFSSFVIPTAVPRRLRHAVEGSCKATKQAQGEAIFAV